MPNERTGHVDWRTWHFDYAVGDTEGLAILNGTYDGRGVIGKFSLPVIRVRYDDVPVKVFGHTFWLPGAGPFADQIRWSLGGDHGLQRIANRGNEYVGLNEYSVGATRWLEICIYARIGAYHIAQQWHFSEVGTILPRVWSKGLHANVNHVHHPYWRLDFDIDSSDHNRVCVHDDTGWYFYPKEANGAKKLATNRSWFVKNIRSGHGAWIIPGPNDGAVDDFSRIDMAVRRYHMPEEIRPWPFGVGGLGFMHGEDVSDGDVVFWYVAHLSHHADEGGDAWHWAGPTIQVQR